MGWNDGVVRPVSLDGLGQRYRRYRLADPEAEEAMAGSLRRWGQLAPVVACVRAERLELIDGFKRLAAARQIRELTSLSVRVLEVDESTAKAAILGLNRDQRPARELEEAWVVQGLVRDDGMSQVEAAQLLGRHKSWVCRRLALLEKLSTAVKEDLRLGLVGPYLARELTRLPAGNQVDVLATLHRDELTAAERKASLNRFVYLALCKVRGTLLRPDLARSGTQVAPIGGDRPFPVGRDRPPAVSGIPRETRLGGIVPFRNADVPQFLLLLFTQVPGQERLDIRRNLAAGRRARLEVPRQPFPGIELPHR